MLCISYLLVHLSNNAQTLKAKILIFKWSALKIEPSGIAKGSKTRIPENKSIIFFLFLIEKTNSASPLATQEIWFVQGEIQLSRKNYCRVHICGYWNLSLMNIQVGEIGEKFAGVAKQYIFVISEISREVFWEWSLNIKSISCPLITLQLNIIMVEPGWESCLFQRFSKNLVGTIEELDYRCNQIFQLTGGL